MNDNPYQAPEGPESRPSKWSWPWRILGRIGCLVTAGGFLLGVYQSFQVFKGIAIGDGVIVYQISLIPGVIMSGGIVLVLIAILGWFTTRPIH